MLNGKLIYENSFVFDDVLKLVVNILFRVFKR